MVKKLDAIKIYVIAESGNTVKRCHCTRASRGRKVKPVLHAFRSV